MKLFKFKSLAIKIWITFSIIILIIICSSSVLYIGVFRSLEENAKIGDLKLSHDILLTNNNFNNPVNRLDEMKNLKGSKHFILNISTDNKMYITDIKQKKDNKHEVDEDGMRSWMASFIKEDKLYEKQFKASYQKKQIIFIISSIKSGNTERSYLISYIKDTKDNSLLYMVAGIGIVFIVLGFFIAKVVANAISRPLKELEAFTFRIAHKNWNEPIKVNSKDEFGRLGSAMNEMQEALKHADEEEKLFLQSISHDLKTPVMVIMSHAEAIIDGVYIESVENTAEIIKSEAVNLQKKIKQLLYLNTLDYMLQNNKENTEVNLQDVLLNSITKFKVVNSKIMWEVETSRIYIYGNMEKMQVVIENILDNQLRYAKEKVCISLKEKEESLVLEIYNDGPNIDEKHIDHIFDNLYKDKTGNFGLGLAICKKIITFYKGEIRVVNRERGVSFIIKLPCSTYSKL
jgi:two-component system sensor histidine kinase CssS